MAAQVSNLSDLSFSCTQTSSVVRTQDTNKIRL